MNGVEELIARAMDLQQTEDDLMPCCNKPVHSAHYLSLAVVAAARIAHDEHAGWNGGYGFGGMPDFEHCWAFPCRVAREFGDLNHEH